MSFASLMDLIYKAMQPKFTIFGVTLNYWSFFVFSVVISLFIWIVNNIFRGE